MAIKFCRRSWRTSRGLARGRVDVTSKAWCSDDRMSIDAVTLGQYNGRGNNADALNGTEYIGNRNTWPERRYRYRDLGSINSLSFDFFFV